VAANGVAARLAAVRLAARLAGVVASVVTGAVAAPTPRRWRRHRPDRPDTRRRRRRQRRVVGALLVAALVAWLLSRCDRAEPPVRLAAVGDMACEPTDPHYAAGSGGGGECGQRAASDVAVALDPDLLLGLGDYQYELPTRAAYADVYGPSWGRLRDITMPLLGNQEYKVHNANTFRAYFGPRAGPLTGYRSFDLGDWHVVLLNSNCTTVPGGCTVGSPQQRWLAADLAASHSPCVLAAWHHPRWSTGIAGPDQRTDALYRTLYDRHVPLLLSAHEHDYERFGPLDPAGRPGRTGIRQFVVGTGGQAHYRPAAGDAAWRVKRHIPPSQFADFDDNGVLLLTLRRGGYDWQFHAVGKGVLDSGSGSCY
jgi:acid phosphatase type 7